ncbi:MAG TPA: phage holin family protein [Candidatus Paceibacterota bacterium]|nr:phage holin family protein [Candidatus Paceibacterota bacterium]
MKSAAKFIIAIVANAAGLLAAGYFVQGFNMDVNAQSLVLLALILTILNFFLKPFLKLLLGPVIILTLGLGLILVNMTVLYILDMLSQNLTIENISALVYSSIIIGLVNFVFHLATKE